MSSFRPGVTGGWDVVAEELVCGGSGRRVQSQGYPVRLDEFEARLTDGA